jgi:hypothetical protein
MAGRYTKEHSAVNFPFFFLVDVGFEVRTSSPFCSDYFLEMGS